jgi:hypothetical protein
MQGERALPPIRFRFRPRKALAAVQQMLLWAREDGRGALDLHTMLKACYFADKAHLNAHWRPVFGATYRAMAYGPVPLEVYELVKGEPLWLAELGIEDVPWQREGYHLKLTGNEAPAREHLSPSDWAALRGGFDQARALSFSERTAESHDRAWERARLGLMRYEDMIEDDNPDREAILDALYEDAHLMHV